MDMICKHEYIGTERGIFCKFCGHQKKYENNENKKAPTRKKVKKDE